MDVARLARDHVMGQEAGGRDMLLLLSCSVMSNSLLPHGCQVPLYQGVKCMAALRPQN